MSAQVVMEDKQKNTVSVSEQILLVEYIIGIIKESGIFENLDIGLNFLSSDKSCLCIRVSEESMKTVEYVDGSYDADIRFVVIYRRLSTTGVVERASAIDKVNELGLYFDRMEDFDLSPEYDIESIQQTTQAGLIYRDDSGIEDNGANFVLRYNKN